MLLRIGIIGSVVDQSEARYFVECIVMKLIKTFNMQGLFQLEVTCKQFECLAFCPTTKRETHRSTFLLFLYLLPQPCPDVYWFPVLSETFANHLVEVMFI